MKNIKPYISFIVILMLSVLVNACVSPSIDNKVVTETNTIRIDQGLIRVGDKQSGLHVFKNIPYAAPPTGALRWRPPQSADSWSDIRDTSKFGAVCPQKLIEGYNLEVLENYEMSEDCLNLNVWTPALGADKKLPVMVWLLPGSFTKGAGQMPKYDGSGIAEQDVVMLNFNYRLGIFGRFAHPALSSTQADEALGNYGTMDQIALLNWVQSNIAAFGGDPDNVTIFGMSAGAVSVNYLMTLDASKGLFHRAISQSSAIRPSNPRHISEDRTRAGSLESAGEKLAKEFGLAEGDAISITKGLRELSTDQVMEYQKTKFSVPGGSLNPVIDGRLIREPVGDVFRDNRQHQVPYMTGATDWEGSLLDGVVSDASRTIKRFRMTREKTKQLYGNDATETDIINGIYTDFFFNSQRYLAQHHAQAGLPTYIYRFSRVLESHLDELPGASHGAETPYVLKTLHNQRLLGEQTGRLGYKISSSDETLSDIISSYWVNFARSGNPNSSGLRNWPARMPERDLLLEFTQNEIIPRENFQSDNYKFFSKLFNDRVL